VSYDLITPNLYNECNEAIGWDLEWVQLLRHPFMRLTNSSVRHDVRVKAKFPLLQNVRIEQEYQLDVHKVTSNAYNEHM
jgi:hypothetical protein